MLTRPSLCRSASLNRASLQLERLEERDAPSATPLPAAVVSAPATAVVNQAVVFQNHTAATAAAPASQVNGGAVSALFANGDPTTGDVHTGLSDAVFSQALQANPNAVLGTSATPDAKAHASKASSALKLTASASTLPAGQTETFTATVTTNYARPTGTVTFKDGSTVLGTVRLDAHGVARLTTYNLTRGTHHITAVYGGDGHVLGSGSATVNVTATVPTSRPAVKPAPTVTLRNVGNVSTSDTSIMFVASVSSARGGTVTLLDGSKVLGQIELDRDGKAALALPIGMSAGRHSLTANYVSADGSARASGWLSLTLAQGASIW
jgi:hypothetical protein